MGLLLINSFCKIFWKYIRKQQKQNNYTLTVPRIASYWCSGRPNRNDERQNDDLNSKYYYDNCRMISLSHKIVISVQSFFFPLSLQRQLDLKLNFWLIMILSILYCKEIYLESCDHSELWTNDFYYLLSFYFFNRWD